MPPVYAGSLSGFTWNTRVSTSGDRPAWNWPRPTSSGLANATSASLSLLPCSSSASLATPGLLREFARGLAHELLADLVLHFVEGARRGGLVLDDAAGDQRVRRDLDRLGIALALDRLGREQRGGEFRIAAADRLHLRARDERRLLDLEVERLADAGQRVRLLVHEVLELVGGGGELLSDLLLLQLFLDLSLDLVERQRARRRGRR